MQFNVRVESRPGGPERPLPLYPRDRTLPTGRVMSVWCQFQKWRLERKAQTEVVAAINTAGHLCDAGIFFELFQ